MGLSPHFGMSLVACILGMVSGQCPQDWTRLDNGLKIECFLLQDSHKTFEESRQHCEGLNSTLATINVILEQKALTTLIRPLGPSKKIWLGGLVDPASGEYKWLDGTDVATEGDLVPEVPFSESCEKPCCMALTIESAESAAAHWRPYPCAEELRHICQFVIMPDLVDNAVQVGSDVMAYPRAAIEEIMNQTQELRNELQTARQAFESQLQTVREQMDATRVELSQRMQQQLVTVQENVKTQVDTVREEMKGVRGYFEKTFAGIRKSAGGSGLLGR